MKRIQINIFDQYKSYRKNTVYDLDGDLIILSGINGSGKSQLLKIISKYGNEPINRTITQMNEDGESIPLENILFLSFRDNINLGNDFGQFSVTYKNSYATKAWEFYKENIKHSNYDYENRQRTRHYKDGTLILNNNGIKKSSWRSIIKLTELIKSNYTEEKVFNLSQTEIESILPPDFIWRD